MSTTFQCIRHVIYTTFVNLHDLTLEFYYGSCITKLLSGSVYCVVII